MKENVNSLERKLNGIIDAELEKEVSDVDDGLVMECSDGLLRIDDCRRYMITESEMKESINLILGKKEPKSVKKLTKPVKIMLIAATLLVLLAVGALGYAQHKYNIFNFSDHSTVLFNMSRVKKVNELEIGFVPDGFEITYESNTKYERTKEFVKGDEIFNVTKRTDSNKIDINTEYKAAAVTHINGIDYIEFGEAKHGQGFVWEKDGCQYVMSGNLSKQDLWKIAFSVS